MDRYKRFNHNRFANNKFIVSSAQFLKMDYLGRATLCSPLLLVQNAVKRDIPQHLVTFTFTLRDSHRYYTRNSYLPRNPNPSTDRGKRITYRFIKDWRA